MVLPASIMDVSGVAASIADIEVSVAVGMDASIAMSVLGMAPASIIDVSIEEGIPESDISTVGTAGFWSELPPPQAIATAVMAGRTRRLMVRMR